MAVSVPDKLKPHNIEAEEAVLGSLLIDPDAIIRIVTFLEPADFYVERHNWIYEAIRDLHERSKPADLVTLTDELERRGQLAQAGGSAYLTGLINATPTSIHVEYYARIVERTAILRRLIDAAGQIARLAYQDTEDASEVQAQAEEIIFGVRRQKLENTKSFKQLSNAELDRMEQVQATGVRPGVSTGLTDLDNLMGGYQPTDFILFAGRPGSGKTSLALSSMLKTARKEGKRVGIFSLEMSGSQLIQRAVSSAAGIDSQKLRLGELKQTDWPAYLQALEELAKLGIYVDDSPVLTAPVLKAKAKRMKAEYDIDIIVVDYLQLMEAGKRVSTRNEEISIISRAHKVIARELNIPVLALSQLSRKVESRYDKHPILADLRDGGSLEQDTDAVLFIYRDEMYNASTEFPGVAELGLAKSRHGPTGVVWAYFRKHTMEFLDLEIKTTSLDIERTTLPHEYTQDPDNNK